MNVTFCQNFSFRAADRNNINNIALTKYNKVLYSDTLSFSGNSMKLGQFETFVQKFQNIYGPDITKGLHNIVSDIGNKIGEGAEKVVYAIPGVDDFVAGILKKQSFSDAPMAKVQDKFPNHNFSQTLGSNGSDLIIMKKVNGESHSLPDWAKNYRAAIYDGVNVPIDKAILFVNQAVTISDFPLDSYVDFAQQVKYLTSVKEKVDIFNPNNVLIDYGEKKFNLIDLMPNSSKFYQIKPEINCTRDMVNVLSDALMHKRYMDALNKDGASKLFEGTKKIISKTQQSGDIAGLSDDSSITFQTYDTLQKLLIAKGRNPKYAESYKGFLDLYRDFLK